MVSRPQYCTSSRKMTGSTEARSHECVVCTANRHDSITWRTRFTFYLRSLRGCPSSGCHAQIVTTVFLPPSGVAVDATTTPYHLDTIPCTLGMHTHARTHTRLRWSTFVHPPFCPCFLAFCPSSLSSLLSLTKPPRQFRSSSPFVILAVIVEN